MIGPALTAPSSNVTARWGVRLAHAMSRHRLETAFAAFLLLAGTRLLLSLA